MKLTIKSSKSVEGTQPCWESRQVRDTAQLSQDRTKISLSLALPPEACLPDTVFCRSVRLKGPAELWVTTNSGHREKATNESSCFSHKHNLFHVVTSGQMSALFNSELHWQSGHKSTCLGLCCAIKGNKHFQMADIFDRERIL